MTLARTPAAYAREPVRPRRAARRRHRREPGIGLAIARVAGLGGRGHHRREPRDARRATATPGPPSRRSAARSRRCGGPLRRGRRSRRSPPTSPPRDVDILVNNGGTIRRTPAAEHTDEDFDHVLDVNLRSAFVLSREVGRGDGRARAAARS